MLPGLLLRIEECVVELDLKDAAARWDEANFRDLMLELFEYPLRQTDGSRRIPSLGAVFDRYDHG